MARTPADCPARPPDRRTVDGQGRVRLRWRLAPNEWVEVLEHRWLAGLPAGDVRHRNGDQQDNRPSNLDVQR